MIEVNSPRLLDLVAEDATVDQICTGFQFTEGPIWHPREQCLYFSDIPADTRRRWSAADGASDVRHPNDKGNGMTLDADLNLYICEHVTSALIRETPSGERQVLASHYNGKELNSPNDVVVKSDGSVYFSDPWYGRMPVFGLERERELGFQAVFRIAPDGAIHCEVDDFDQPNGLCFSPDESILYVNDTTRAHIRVFDVGADGSLSNGRMFAENIGDGELENGVVDGMKCDEQGANYELGMLLAEVFFQAKQFLSASQCLARVLEAKPDHFEATLLMGLLEKRNGNPHAAQQLLEAAVGMRNDSASAHATLGSLFLDHGNRKQALEHLKRALELHPSATIHFMLSAIYYEGAKHKRAIDHLKLATQLDPDYGEAFYQMGRLCLEMNWRRKAKECFTNARRINPREQRYHQEMRGFSEYHVSPDELGGLVRDELRLTGCGAKRSR